MRDKKSRELIYLIDHSIKVGDKVRITDGSALTCDESDSDVYIVYAYPKLTGSIEKLKDIEGTVIATSINNRVCSGACDTIYLQDCIVQLGDAVFNTASGLLTKV